MNEFNQVEPDKKLKSKKDTNVLKAVIATATIIISIVVIIWKAGGFTEGLSRDVEINKNNIESVKTDYNDKYNDLSKKINDLTTEFQTLKNSNTELKTLVTVEIKYIKKSLQRIENKLP